MTDERPQGAESSTPTFEEAARCPKCGQPGQDTGGKPAERRGVLIHTIYCRNKLCPWLDSSWLIQVNEDGSIPAAYSQLGPKKYPTVSAEMATRIEEGIRAQLRAETRGDGEIRGRN